MYCGFDSRRGHACAIARSRGYTERVDHRDLLTLEEAASLLGLTPSYIEGLVLARELTAERVEGVVTVRKVHAMEWAATRGEMAA